MDATSIYNSPGSFIANYESQLIMMCVIPFITKIIDTVFKFVGLLLLFFGQIFAQWGSSLKTKFLTTTPNRILIQMTKGSSRDGWNISGITIEESALPILWYINKRCEKLDVTRMLNISIANPAEIAVQTHSSHRDRYKDDDHEIPIKKTSNIFIPISTVNDSTTRSIIDGMTSSKDDKDKDNNEQRIQSDRLNSQKFTDNSKDIEIEKDIYVQFVPMGLLSTWRGSFELTAIVIKSWKKNTRQLQEFLTNIEKDYNEYFKSQCQYKGKIFIYKCMEDDTPVYSVYDIDKSQTFDNLFFEQKDMILTLLNRLSDREFFQKRGIKRKISAIFTGEGGTGKTCCVTAIANFTGRTIIYVPVSRITTNSEIEAILYNKIYNQYIIENDDKIVLFDEIDSLTDLTLLKKSVNITSDERNTQTTDSEIIVIQSDSKEKNTPTTTSKKNNNDKFNIGVFLNLLDGINNQDGMIIIATANNISALDPSLYREGRLTHFAFRNMSRNEIVKMIEKYYATDLSPEQRERISDERILQNLKLKTICLRGIDDGISVDDVIDNINKAVGQKKAILL